jgi:signal transduction histidine kinase
VISLISPNLAGSEKLLVVAAAAGLSALYWLLVARHPEWWERRLGILAGFWAVACGLTALLATLNESFTILMYGLYPLMFATLGWWGMVPVVGLTALMGWALGGWGSGSALVTNLLATAGLAAVISVFINVTARQSEQRRDALNALAATRAQLAETARQAGVLAERERLARELHDTVAQGFISVVTQLESAEQVLDERPQEAHERLEIARRTARENLQELRATVRALRPDLLSDAPLSLALERAAARWSATASVPVQVRVTGQALALRPDTELALLRTAQEALANVGRHASATRVVLSLSYLGDTVTLDVDDDGVGFEKRERPLGEGGFGLVGMRERVEAAGGEFTIESTPGQGTCIAVSVPA